MNRSNGLTGSGTARGRTGGGRLRDHQQQHEHVDAEPVHAFAVIGRFVFVLAVLFTVIRRVGSSSPSSSGGSPSLVAAPRVRPRGGSGPQNPFSSSQQAGSRVSSGSPSSVRDAVQRPAARPSRVRRAGQRHRPSPPEGSRLERRRGGTPSSGQPGAQGSQPGSAGSPGTTGGQHRRSARVEAERAVSRDHRRPTGAVSKGPQARPARRAVIPVQPDRRARLASAGSAGSTGSDRRIARFDRT